MLFLKYIRANYVHIDKQSSRSHFARWLLMPEKNNILTMQAAGGELSELLSQDRWSSGGTRKIDHEAEGCRQERCFNGQDFLHRFTYSSL